VVVTKFEESEKIKTMKSGNNLLLSTSPQPQPAKKLRRLANRVIRQRLSYIMRQRNNTGKELDPETGLYYFGARYLDPKTSRWMSGDPAVGEYIPVAPANEEARKRNGSLPGQGGVFNYVNLHVYHYAGNNPVKLVDPDGEITESQHFNRNQYQNGYAPANKERMDALVRIGLFINCRNTATHNLTPAQNNQLGRATALIPHGTNIDYRGAPSTIFEGMQFIYSEIDNDIVLDSVNKGTFDYRSPFTDAIAHNSIDRDPWVKWGNGPADIREEVVMEERIWTQIDGVLNLYNTGRIGKEQAMNMIQGFFPSPPPVPQDLEG